jgi:hypothetical protein
VTREVIREVTTEGTPVVTSPAVRLTPWFPEVDGNDLVAGSHLRLLLEVEPPRTSGHLRGQRQPVRRLRPGALSVRDDSFGAARRDEGLGA